MRRSVHSMVDVLRAQFRGQGCVRVVFCALLLAFSSSMASVSAAETATGTSAIVPAHDVFEVTLRSARKFDNPFWDVGMHADFVAPSGARIAVDGFYSGEGQWRVRFVPREPGTWRYVAQLVGQGLEEKSSGEFVCGEGTTDGFLKLSKRNPYRLEYDSGRPFHAIGVQTCGLIANVDFDGPNPDGSWRTVSVEQWCEAFRGAVNLVRVQLGTGTKAGLAVDLIPDSARPDHYDLANADGLDRMYRLHRKAGFCEMANLFQDMSAYGRRQHALGTVNDQVDFKSVTAPNIAIQERYLRYIVARYACFVDIWEIFNEDSFAPDEYLQHLFDVIRAADPYDHVITTNFSRPDKPFCEIIVPHRYVFSPATEVDALLTAEIAAMKSYGKVVQYSEFGNKSTLSNVDPTKWRVAAWASFMNESGILFWSMSGMKTVPTAQSQGNSNTYLGADSREHFRVLLNFTRELPIDLRPQAVDGRSRQFRAYALGNNDLTILYLHHHQSHEQATSRDSIRVQTGPGRFRLRWFDPQDGKQMGPDLAMGGRQAFMTLSVPPFTVDAVCRIDRVERAPDPVLAPALPPADPATEHWLLAWKPDFSAEAMARDWVVFDGDVEPVGEILRLSAFGSSEAEMELRKPSLPGSVRIEMVAWLQGDEACDLDVMLNAGSLGSRSGYLFQLGGKGNTITRLVRADKQIDATVRSDLKIEPGRAYRIVAENDQGVIRLRINGAEIFSAIDPQPLTGAGHDRIGFYTFGGDMCIMDLKVYVPREQEPTGK
jgi:hypothetical protein